jgi:hypothetical protein
MGHLKVKSKLVEKLQGTDIPMTAGVDTFGPTDTIEQWLVARGKINAEYLRLKSQGHSPPRTGTQSFVLCDYNVAGLYFNP